MLNSEFIENKIDIDYWNKSVLHRFIYRSFISRKFEEFCAEKKRIGLINGPVHLAIGQESIPACISEYLTKEDSIFGAHRSHAHYLSLGGSPSKLLAEILGSPKGLSSGRGCSMHIFDKSVGFMGSVPIVSGTFALAVGSGFAKKYQNNNSIAVSYVGDGSFEEGIVAEGLNMARLLSSRLLVVVENNQYASHMHLSLRQSENMIRNLSKTYGIKYKFVDSYNYDELNNVVKESIKEIREQNMPIVLECSTFRWKGHVDWRDDLNVGVTRSMEEVEFWKDKCPLNQLIEDLKDENIVSKLDFLNVKLNIELEKTTRESISDRQIPAKTEELLSYTLPDNEIK